MTRKRYIQDPNPPYDLIPIEEYRARQEVHAPYVMPDIQPYQAMGLDVATGSAPVITSRSAHRDYLRRNGYVELGNDIKPQLRTEVRGDFNVRADLTRVAREVLSRR